MDRTGRVFTRRLAFVAARFEHRCIGANSKKQHARDSQDENGPIKSSQPCEMDSPPCSWYSGGRRRGVAGGVLERQREGSGGTAEGRGVLVVTATGQTHC